MNNTAKNVLIIILSVIALALLARYVVFKEKFDQIGAGLERVGTWQENYIREHPGASKEEVDAAFDASIANLKVWKAQYKQDHPTATDAEIDAAFNAQFKSKE